MTETREERLRIVSHGKCKSEPRSFEGRIKYVPTINGMTCQISQDEEDCYRTSKEAVAAAQAFRAQAQKKLREEYGG